MFKSIRDWLFGPSSPKQDEPPKESKTKPKSKKSKKQPKKYEQVQQQDQQDLLQDQQDLQQQDQQQEVQQQDQQKQHVLSQKQKQSLRGFLVPLSDKGHNPWGYTEKELETVREFLTQQLAKKQTVVSPSMEKLLQRLYSDFEEEGGASSRKRVKKPSIPVQVDTTQQKISTTTTSRTLPPITPPPNPHFGPYPYYRSLFRGIRTPDRIWEDEPPTASSEPKPSRSKGQKGAIQQQQQVEVQEQYLQQKGVKAPKKQKGTNRPNPKHEEKQQQVSEAGAQLNRINPKAKPFVSRRGGGGGSGNP